jgi:hypothetical protein
VRIFTDESVRPPHLPLVPLLQAIGCRRTEHDTWWEQHAPGGDAVVALHHELVDDPGQADAVVVPLDWYWVRGPSWASRPDRRLARRLAEVVELGTQHNVPVVIFFTGDRSSDRVALDGAVVFREGGYRSRSRALDRSMPAFVDDLVTTHLGSAVLIDRPSRPTVGFCGLAARRTSAGDRSREAAALALSLAYNRTAQPSQYTGENLRCDAMDALQRHHGVETDFIVRTKSVFFGQTDTADVRTQFVDNMVANAYTLCIRGSGNYSYRLYEAMSMGRIPVIVDTDLALPRDDVIPWSEIAVWAAADQVDRLGDVVEAFHERLSPGDFVDLQHRLRQIWLDHLRPQAWLADLDEAMALDVLDARG